MSYKVLFTPEFEKEIKRLASKYPFLRKDFTSFLSRLEQNPIQGTPLGSNCYKVRLAISSKGKGKSGGGRIITCVLVKKEEVILISIYDKSEKETITNEEIIVRLRKYLP